MQINREDVVQAALVLERWCFNESCTRCPFWYEMDGHNYCAVSTKGAPLSWNLEEFLRTRGLNHD